MFVITVSHNPNFRVDTPYSIEIEMCITPQTDPDIERPRNICNAELVSYTLGGSKGYLI